MKKKKPSLNDTVERLKKQAITLGEAKSDIAEIFGITKREAEIILEELSD